MIGECVLALVRFEKGGGERVMGQRSGRDAASCSGDEHVGEGE